jgi:hypothetical protein
MHAMPQQTGLMDELMNRYQKTAVAVALYRFEENLREALRWLDGAEVDGILFHRRLDLPEGERVAAKKLIAKSLAEIEALAQSLNLEKQEENSARDLMAVMNMSWEELSDSLSYKLRGFGPVNPGLSGLLDAPLEHLAHYAYRLGNIFARGRKALS